MPVLVLKNAFPRIAAALQIEGKVVEADIAHRIAGEARAQAPVLTGALRASVRSKGGEVYTDNRYSRFVEFGTRNMSAEPFFYNAVNRQQGPLVGRLFAILRSFG